ncbi:hypothetical protein HK405_000673, partial [Cladochytrium tenue]
MCEILGSAGELNLATGAHELHQGALLASLAASLVDDERNTEALFNWTTKSTCRVFDDELHVVDLANDLPEQDSFNPEDIESDHLHRLAMVTVSAGVLLPTPVVFSDPPHPSLEELLIPEEEPPRRRKFLGTTMAKIKAIFGLPPRTAEEVEVAARLAERKAAKRVAKQAKKTHQGRGAGASQVTQPAAVAIKIKSEESLSLTIVPLGDAEVGADKILGVSEPSRPRHRLRYAEAERVQKRKAEKLKEEARLAMKQQQREQAARDATIQLAGIIQRYTADGQLVVSRGCAAALSDLLLSRISAEAGKFCTALPEFPDALRVAFETAPVSPEMRDTVHEFLRDMLDSVRDYVGDLQRSQRPPLLP